jgi:uncharacterized protein DUF2752
VLTLGALAAGALDRGGTDAALAGGVPCPFRAVTGVRCPLCGMTHATVALGSGDLGGAFAAHPLFPLVLALVLWGGWQLARGRPLSIGGRRVPLPALLALIGAIWVVNALWPSIAR